MKNLILAIPLFFATPSCHLLEAVAAVPSAAVADVTAGVDVLTPSEEATVEAVGTAAQVGGTAVGGPAVGAAAGSLATLLAQWALRKRKSSK